MHHQQQLAAARTQLLTDVQSQLRILVHATATLTEALPDDAETRLLVMAYADAAYGCFNNVASGIAVAIDVTAHAHQCDSEPATLTPGELLKSAINAEVTLCMATMIASEHFTEEQAGQLDRKLDQLANQAEQLAASITSAKAANQILLDTIAAMRANLDQVEQAAADPAQLAEVEIHARCLPDALRAGIDSIRAGVSRWRTALRKLHSPLN